MIIKDYDPSLGLDGVTNDGVIQKPTATKMTMTNLKTMLVQST